MQDVPFRWKFVLLAKASQSSTDLVDHVEIDKSRSADDNMKVALRLSDAPSTYLV